MYDVACAHLQERLKALLAQRDTEILSMRAEMDGLRLALEVLLLLLLLLLLLMCGALAGEESNHKQRITRSQEALAHSSLPCTRGSKFLCFPLIPAHPPPPQCYRIPLILAPPSAAALNNRDIKSSPMNLLQPARCCCLRFRSPSPQHSVYWVGLNNTYMGSSSP